MAVSRIEELLATANDVRPEDAAYALPLANAGREHRERFDRYIRELRTAKRAADEWWQGMVESEADRVGDERHAAINVTTKRRGGAVSDPNAIHTIRSAWLDCQEINDRAARGNRVAPAVFVLRWLQEARKPELAEFVGSLRYWPLGLDESGRWT